MSDVISLRGLTKTFGESRGITEVSLRVEAGQVFGFLGPNGAGKTTTIRLILGLYRPTRGSATVLGFNPITDPVALHRRTGYLPGDLSLYPRLTGREILQRFARLRGRLDAAYRDELVTRFAVELDRPVRTLSKGNRQKLGLVLAFMHRPELLVLDEPTSGLDPLLQDEFARLLDETTEDGRTVFLSSHDLAEVQRVVHRLAIIKEGRIVVTDTVQGLRANAPRTIQFQFARPVDASEFNGLPGTRVVAHDGTRVTISSTGALGPVLTAAARLDPVDIEARAADLDELFLGYYGARPTGGDADGH